MTRAKDGSVTESASAQTANASLPCWRNLVNNTKLTVGCNNVFGQDPPQAYVTGDAYPQFLYDPVGRFVYASLKKKF